MPLVTCPDCLAKFESTGMRGASCPTCGYRIGVARPVGQPLPTARRSTRRHDEDEDEDEEYDRPARRPDRPRRSASNSIVPLLILGGVLFAILVVGGVGFLVFLAVSKSPSRNQQVVQFEPTDIRPRVNPGPPDVAMPELPIGGPPGGPIFTPPPPLPPPPFPGGPPGMPGFPDGPPGMPARPPGFPGGPQSPNAAAPAATLSNLRRSSRGGVVLEVDYEFTAGARHPIYDSLIVKTASGLGEVKLRGVPQTRGTIQVRSLGLGRLDGKVEVWMERRSPSTHPGNSGQKISNTLTLD